MDYSDDVRLRRYSGAVGTIDLPEFIAEFDGWCAMQALRYDLFTPFMAWKILFLHLEGSPMKDYIEFGDNHPTEIEAWRRKWSPTYVSIINVGVVAKAEEEASSGISLPIPAFNPIVEFFKILKENYQRWRDLDNQLSLKTFERKEGESLREAYTRMRRLVRLTDGVTDGQAVQLWYQVLDKDLRRVVRFLASMSKDKLTLKSVFEISDRIELNRYQEKVVSLGFIKEAAKGVFASGTPEQSQVECFVCHGPHMKRDCPEIPSQKCEHCQKEGHGIERCFILHPELIPRKSGGKGRGGDRIPQHHGD